MISFFNNESFLVTVSSGLSRCEIQYCWFSEMDFLFRFLAAEGEEAPAPKKRATRKKKVEEIDPSVD